MERTGIGERQPRHVVLVGLMGAGKSTIGERVADRLGRPFIDSDAVILELKGRHARQVAADEGVGALHTLEHRVVTQALAGDTPAVVAAAASAADNAELVAALRNHVCVWLRADEATLAQRQPGGVHRRPIEAGEADRIAQRTARYRELAALAIDTGVVGIDAGVELIFALCRPDQ
jgi:shikimate kinase